MSSNKKSLENFIGDQLSRWPLACGNFRALKNVCEKKFLINGLAVKAVCNPSRIVSTAASLAPSAISARKCFLCRDNRPPEQINMKFEGRKGKKYDVLVNPYPIFPNHLVLASDRHVVQSIRKRYVDMLDMARAYHSYSIMYNGPECGASAPDHFHFQAVGKGKLPLASDVSSLFASRQPGDGELRHLVSVQDADLYLYGKFARGIFVLNSKTVKSAAKLFYRLLDCADIREESGEPMFNLVSEYEGGYYRSIIIFREKHRPACYYSEGESHFTVSPGCADMAGAFVFPVKDEFDRLDASVLETVLDEVAASKETEEKIISRLIRGQQMLEVGLMSGKELEFEILSDGAGPRKAVYREGKIEYDGALFDELFFEAPTLSTMFAEASFVLHDVVIGKDFHWERKENQRFAGALKIIVEKDVLTAVNVIGVEDYLVSVISSEMKSSASPEFLKAHAVISRSWVLEVMRRRREKKAPYCPEGVNDVPSLVSYLDMLKYTGEEFLGCGGAGETPVVEHIRWYGHEDHKRFDVCADDHCQRYQGLTRAAGLNARKAVDATWGQVLVWNGGLCDTRFSKCCGGASERFSVCWEDKDYPYLASLPDTAGHEPGTSCFCHTSDRNILSQVLNDYDLETEDFYHWTVAYDKSVLASIISGRSGHDIGELKDIIPLERGGSGRINRLKIVGSALTLVVGKELEIRRILSESHLKSSAFDIRFDCDRVILEGKGWGHGVGLCQIGAAVMASEGYPYMEILSHYYPGSELSSL